ncbi:Ectonucleoside triphosphate diphosphohydrolase [Perkinsus olseni]|nr:Ectonucleoside triphosphate diphosphohydrolase [Perkinsus olseni]
MTFFRKVDGGLSAYKENPEEAREGLEWLLKEASSGVPEAVGCQAMLLATAGLRLIRPQAAEKLLQVSRRVIRDSPFTLVRDEDVAVLDGSDEGLYMWRSVDFIYGAHSSSLASKPSAVVDLGGGSVQLAYRMLKGSQVSPSDRNKFTDYLRPTFPIEAAAPSTSSEKRMKDYFLASAASIRPQSMADGPLYVHSWLGYGLEAARQRILQENTNGVRLSLHLDHLPSSSRYQRCLATVRAALDLDQDCGATQASECAFNGAWRGPLDPSSYTFRVFSYVFDVARSNGLVPTGAHEVVVTVAQFRDVARARCAETVGGGSLPWACLDAVYVTSLLSDGFGIPDTQPTVVAERLSYDKGGLLYAAWPLGAALERLE